MKICLINSLYPPYHRGGAEKVAKQMADNLRAQNQEVFIITTKPEKPDLGKNETESVYYLDSDFYNLSKKPVVIRLFWHLHNIFSKNKASKIASILKQEKPDLIITHNLMGVGFQAVKEIAKSNIVHYHFLHDIQLLHPSGLMIYGQEKKMNLCPLKLYRYFTKKIFNSPTKVLSPSKWLLEEHQKYGFFKDSETKIRTLSSIFNNQEAGSKNRPDDIEKEVLVNKIENKNIKKLLFAGQIETHKGILFLIKAFQELAKDDMTLHVAGSGSKLEEAQNLALNDKRIILLGNLNKEELTKQMKEADILVVPSLCYENSPLIISEAKSVGLQVIASNIGGIPEALGSTDILFAPNSKQDLFEKLS